MFRRLIKPLAAFKPCFCVRSCSCLHKCFPGVPHPPKDPPMNYNPTELNTDCFSAPENVQLLVFRPLQKGEVLGPKASKHKEYKNPEYYAYHRYSFIDLQKNALRIKMENCLREMCPNLVKEIESREELGEQDGDCKDSNGENE